MTVRDSATALALRGQSRVGRRTVSLYKILTNVLHKGLDSSAAMVTGDVGVQVLPDALDLIVVRAVGGQEMQLDFAPDWGVQAQVDERCAVNAVIVKNHVNRSRLPVMAGEFPQQAYEQSAVLSFPFDPDELSGPDIQRSGAVAVDVFARREHFFLLPA